MLEELRRLEIGHKGIYFPTRTIPLHSMLFSCGHDIVRSPGYSWHGLKRGNNEFAIWQFTLSGMGMLDFEGRTMEVPPGHAMLLHVPHDHCYYFPKDAGHWEFVYLSLQGRDLIRIMKELIRRNGPVARFEDGSRTLSAAMEMLDGAFKGALDSPFLTSELAYKIMMGMLDDTGMFQGDGERAPAFMKTVAEFCQENMDRDIDVDDMAREAGYSRYHFSRMFKDATGMSPAAFLNDLRMKHAIRMLQMEKASVKEIAARCGFQDASYFCKVFRKNFSVSPLEFRRGGD